MSNSDSGKGKKPAEKKSGTFSNKKGPVRKAASGTSKGGSGRSSSKDYSKPDSPVRRPARGTTSRSSSSRSSSPRGSAAGSADAEGSARGTGSRGSATRSSGRGTDRSRGASASNRDAAVRRSSRDSDSRGSSSRGSASRGSDSRSSEYKGSGSRGSDSRGSSSRDSDSRSSDFKRSPSRGSDSRRPAPRGQVPDFRMPQNQEVLRNGAGTTGAQGHGILPKKPTFRRRPASAAKASSSEPGKIRLNRYVANAGVCSRREADTYIAAGNVTVNGKVISEMGYKVDPTDEVRFDGRLLQREKKEYVLLNKPKNFVTTTKDEKGRRTVMELITRASASRLLPVGRLDRNTTGLLLFTNDGDLAKKLTHPKHGVRKIYHVELDANLKAG